MATRAAAFSSKIRTLNDYYNNIVSGVTPLPSTYDIALVLKQFTLTLLGVLKEMTIDHNQEQTSGKHSYRISKYPSLNYSSLYHSLINLIDVVPLLQPIETEPAESIINTLACLAPFLPYELLDALPYTFATTLTTFPTSVQKKTLDTLCNTLLPINMAYTEYPEHSMTLNSIASILFIIFENSDNEKIKSKNDYSLPGYHAQIMECLLSLKADLIYDILFVIAHGAASARAVASNLLFFYWPMLNPTGIDRRSVHFKFSPRKPIICQTGRCTHRQNIASKVCVNILLSKYGENMPPPLYMCTDCYKSSSKDVQQFCRNILCPVSEISLHCQNKLCISDKKITHAVCYSIDCCLSNGNHPISLCRQCHERRHIDSNHVYQETLIDMWRLSPDVQNHCVEAIISLLRETDNNEEKRIVDSMSDEKKSILAENIDNTATMFLSLDIDVGRKLLSRYGIYLILGLIEPTSYGPPEMFGRILSMLFLWFHSTVRLPGNEIGSVLGKLKSEYVIPWLKSVVKEHHELVIALLLPHPVEYAKVGGIWETMANRTTQVIECLNKLYDLMPDGIITYEIWDYIMPYWMESIRLEVPENDLTNLNLLFRKMFDPDPDMSPSSLTRDQLYHFITDRFQSPAPASVQEQALQWLQILCLIDIYIPVPLLVQIFTTGTNSLQKLESRAQRREHYTMAASSSNEQSMDNGLNLMMLSQDEGNVANPTGGIAGLTTMSGSSSTNKFLVFDTYETYRAHRHQLMLQQMTGQEMVSIIKEEEEEFIINESEINSTCCIMMVDMTLKQMELQQTPQHQGMYNPLSKEILSLMNKQLILPWARRHRCRTSSSQCSFCEEYILWFSIAQDILKYISPRDEIKLPELELPNLSELKQQQLKQQQLLQQQTLLQSAKSTGKPKFSIEIPTAGDNQSLSSSSTSLNNEETTSNANATTTAITTAPSELKVENNPDGGIWITSQGVFYFKLNTLHIHLQFFYSVLKELDRIIDIDALYYLLCCLKLLILNDECLETAAKDNRGFLSYCLEKLLVPHIWKILALGHGHLNECCVPLLLHALNYEPGKTALWDILERDFSSTHWKVRSSAGTRVIALYSLLKPKLIKNNYNVLSVLAYAFLNLITSIEDVEPTVSQKAMCSLETLGDASFKSVMCSLEFQFDTVINDRSIILHRLSKLYTILLRNNSTIKILSWEYFLNRFDTLSIESQINMEESGELISPQSIGGFNTESEHFIRKLNQIRFAMARTDSIKPISTSARFLTHHRRTTIVNSQPSNNNTDKIETDSIGSFISPTVDNSDKSTLQLLVNLLTKFMMKDDQSQVNEDRIMLKQQNVVVRHICSLLGYNQTNRTFVTLPSKIRRSPVFHAFLSNLPKVLDYNFNLGSILLQFFLSFLQFSTCSNATMQFYDHICASNTLGRIDPSLRDSWLMTLIIILYKYQYTSNAVTIQHLTRVAMNTIVSHYHQCETPPFGATGCGLSGRITPKVAGSRRGSSRPFDDIREVELNELGTRYDLEGDTQSESASIAEHKRFRLLSPPKKVKAKFYKPEIECFDEPLTIRQTEDQMPSTGRSYTEFLKSFFASSGTASATGLNSGTSAGTASSTTQILPTEKLTELDAKGIKGVKELSRVIYSAERGKLETVLLKPSVGGFKEESPPKTPKVTSLSSSTLVSMGGAAPGGKLKPSYYSKKTKHKDDSNVRSPTLSRPTRTSSSQGPLKAGITTSSGVKRSATATNEESDNPYADTDLHNQMIAAPKCDKCGQPIEYYNEECIGYCIIVCGTLVHREPAIAAPLLMDMIETIGRVAASHIYTWQENSTVVAPANSRSIAQQFIRCTFQQLAANNISYQFFQQNFRDERLLHTIALSLNDFPEFNSIIALKWLLNDMNKQKSLSLDICTTLLSNIAQFMEYIPIDSPIQLWTSVFLEFDFLFDKLTRVYTTIKSSTQVTYDLTPILRIMMNILKVPYIANVRLVLDPFSKLLTFILRNGTFQLEHIIELCSLSNRTFTRDREKFLLPRCIVNVLVEAMLHRYPCPDRNLLLMIQLILLDSGGTIHASAIVSDDVRAYDPHNVVTTNGAECMKHYLNETVAFIADIHTITKIKSTMKEKSEKQQLSNLTEDTLGGQLKAGLAQYLALEFTKGGQRDSKAIVRFLPWLYNPPTSVQQGAKDFVDCIDRIRFLSWLMIGSLTHAAITRNEGTIICHPIPVDASQSIADYILYILTGFADQSKTSVIHMSSLFHSFILCQLWTMYCEQVNRGHDPEALVAIMDFWARITPGILHLLSHSKVDKESPNKHRELAEMVNLHFLSLIEALQEINSIVLANLFAMWVPVLYTHQSQLPAHVQVRLQTCLNHQPSSETQGDLRFMYAILLKWLNRLQFKIGQIETQSSHAAQFYSL
ncbi:unnamed protein product [Rotaria socialis]|uniref:Unc-79-like protein n=2 Tax=Rotaria socialis TaxID=392032 RepID=A0A818YXK5_9BILA|nr:unnamed protein product [Rotaria socialis]CAF3333060.1 unnamed protein product [Rotaria socialis]CAF3761805.1 unnamed protein product [Rotaria socialis]